MYNLYILIVVQIMMIQISPPNIKMLSTRLNPDHITLNTNTPTRVPSTTLQQTSSPDITMVSNTQLNTHYHQTTYPYLPQLTYDMTTDNNGTHGLSPTTRKRTGHNSRKTQSPLLLRPPYPPTYTLPTNCLQTSC